MKRERSSEIFARAQQLMPGGVNSPARAFGAVGGEPIVIAEADGCRLTDVDGNRYIDYVLSWGPAILGHTHPAVLEAIEAAARKGFSFGAPTEGENELTELIVDAVDSIEKVRLVNSGTEATMSAIRLARGATGRNVIIKFAGNYHGHADSLLVAAGSAAATLSVPNSPGVTPGCVQDTMVLSYNNAQQLEDAFNEHGDQIAGVIFEPVVGNMGCVVAQPDFLTALREQTQKHGALLICDEVMTGFRISYGGAQAVLGIEPDITTLGKVVGGGMPIGAYGGRADIMNHMLPAGDVFQAGTLSGNPVATAAGATTLKLLRDQPPYEHMETLGQRLEQGLREAASAAKIPFAFERVGSMATLFFHDGDVQSWDDAARCNTKQFAKYFWGMLDRGVYLPCSQYEALFLSQAHDEAAIDTTLAAAREALAEAATVA